MVTKNKVREIREIKKELEDLQYKGIVRNLEGKGTKRIEKRIKELRQELKASKKKTRKKSYSAY